MIAADTIKCNCTKQLTNSINNPPRQGLTFHKKNHKHFTRCLTVSCSYCYIIISLYVEKNMSTLHIFVSDFLCKNKNWKYLWSFRRDDIVKGESAVLPKHELICVGNNAHTHLLPCQFLFREQRPDLWTDNSAIYLLVHLVHVLPSTDSWVKKILRKCCIATRPLYLFVTRKEYTL